MANNTKTIVDIAKSIIINERTGKAFEFETASEVDVDPKVSQGKEEIKRIHNKILGIKRTEDIVYGYKLKLKDNVFNLDLMQLIDGGKLENDEYVGIPAGEVVDKDEFTLVVFSEELEYKKVVGYVQFTWKHCLGKAPKWSIKDGKFVVPEFNAESIPDKGEKPVSVKSIKELPKDLTTFSKEVLGKQVSSAH